MKVGDLVKDKLWGKLGIVVCVPPMSSMIEVFWTGARRQKHLLGDLELVEKKIQAAVDEIEAREKNNP